MDYKATPHYDFIKITLIEVIFELNR